VLAAIRLLVVLRADALTSLPDEVGYLGDAWMIARGRPAPPMGFSPFYPGGFPVLVAPFAAVTDAPDVVAMAARVLNVALLAAVVPTLMGLLARLGRLDPVPRALVAVAASAAPGLWIAAAYVWPDALAAFLWPVALLALGRLVTGTGPLLSRLWFGPSVAALWVVHARFMPVVVLGGALLVTRILDLGIGGSEASNGHPRRDPADVANLVLGAVVIGAGLALNGWLESRWTNVAPGPLDGIGDDLAATTGGALRSLAGQAWYALVGTLGLAAVGAVTLTRAAWEARPRPSALWSEPVPALAAFTLTGALAVMVGAAVQLRSPVGFGEVVDFGLLANGRYQDVVLVPLVAVGLARVVRRVGPAVGLEVGLILAATVLAVVVGVAAGTDSVAVSASSSAGATWGFEWWPQVPTAVPTIALAAAVAAVVALRRLTDRARALVVPVVALLALGAIGLERADAVSAGSRAAAEREPGADRVRDLVDGQPVAYALDPSTVVRSFELGWELAPGGLLLYPAGDTPPARLVIAPIGPDGGPGVDGLASARREATLPTVGGRDLALWRMPPP